MDDLIEQLDVGVLWSMLAEGADRLTAERTLMAGRGIAAVLPFEGYEDDFRGRSRLVFQRQLAACAEVVRLPGMRSDAHYLDAGREIVRRGEVLLAVWDGEPAEGPGGTGDIVGYAQSVGRPVVVIDPDKPDTPHWLAEFG